MKRSLLQAFALTASVAFVAAGCGGDSAMAPDTSARSVLGTIDGEQSYIVLAKSETALPGGFAAAVQKAGGTVRESMDKIGVAVVSSSAADFALKLRRAEGIESVVPDPVKQWVAPPAKLVELTASPMAEGPAAAGSSIGDDEPFYAIQWGPGAIHAPEAWNAGARGTGVRVAVLDGGIYDNHIDLRGAVDVARSRSFVAGKAFNQDVGTFWHGTHVAGIIAARHNRTGVIGIAPEATIIGVKVLDNGSGSFSAILNGIVYAATPIAEGGAGAQIINMSLGARFTVTEPGDIALIGAVSRATNYAYNRGVAVIVSAGNDAVDDDTNDPAEAIIPARAARTITVSALGPKGWALGSTDLDRQASYTNFGMDLVDFSGPGGDFDYPGNELCTVAGITNSCWVFDMYLSTARGTTANGSYSWAAGTSMAAPAVAGVAALLIERNGPVGAAGIKNLLRNTSDDLGAPGKDAVYGYGRVNALNAAN